MTFANFSHDFISLMTLLFLEVVLGIDNLIFISIACSRLPKAQQASARTFGLLLALVTRLLLLASVTWLASFTYPLFHIADFAVSGRDLLLCLGGVFLLYKGTEEIHAEFDSHSQEVATKKAMKSMPSVIAQIAVLDIIFSLDSVITAIGMTQKFWIMAVAISIAIIFMIFASQRLSDFIDKNPTIKMLAVSFILMVGMVLVADGLHYHVPRGYVYFSIAFSLFVEAMNITLRRKRQRQS